MHNIIIKKKTFPKFGMKSKNTIFILKVSFSQNTPFLLYACLLFSKKLLLHIEFLPLTLDSGLGAFSFKVLAVCLEVRFALGLETGESKCFRSGLRVCACVRALSLDKPQSRAATASCSLLQQERKKKTPQKR